MELGILRRWKHPLWDSGASRGNGKEPRDRSPVVPTLSCPCTALRCFCVSATWQLAWLSCISMSFRSPSIFFFSLKASFLLLTSASSMVCIDSNTLWWFLFSCWISSSFSAVLLSTSDFTWFSSSWTRKIFPSSCSKEPCQGWNIIICSVHCWDTPMQKCDPLQLEGQVYLPYCGHLEKIKHWKNWLLFL